MPPDWAAIPDAFRALYRTYTTDIAAPRMAWAKQKPLGPGELWRPWARCGMTVDKAWLVRPSAGDGMTARPGQAYTANAYPQARREITSPLRRTGQ